MATARIEAGVVLQAAERRCKQTAEAVSYAKDKWFERRLQEPEKRGWLWWRRPITLAELEREYVRVERPGCATHEKIVEGHLWPLQRQAWELRDLAKAALTGDSYSKVKGDGFVTLDADEVRFLGLEAQ